MPIANTVRILFIFSCICLPSLSRTYYLTYLRSDHVLVGLVHRVYKRCAWWPRGRTRWWTHVTRVHVDLMSNMCFCSYFNKATSILATMSKQHCRRYKLNDSFDSVQCCFDIVAVFAFFPISATMSNEISSFRQCRNKLNMFNLFRHRRKDEILQ